MSESNAREIRERAGQSGPFDQQRVDSLGLQQVLGPVPAAGTRNAQLLWNS